MKTFDERLTENARLVMLRELAAMADGTLNETILQAVLDGYAHRRSRQWVKEQLRVMESLGAVKVTELATGFMVAELTRAGLDHVERRTAIDGIDRPSPVN